MSVKVIDSFRRIVATKGASTNGQVVADADNDTLTLDAGAGMKISVDENTDKIILEVESAAEFLAGAVGTFEVFADDSTVRTVGANEQLGFVGAGTVTTATDAEGAVTITGDDDLSNFDNSTSGFISDITNESIGDLSDVALSSIGDGELLQWNSGSFINRTITEAGFATVSTTGSYNDLSNRPNLTFDGDLSGNTGGAVSGGASTITLTLDNVNSNVGTFNSVTVNAKGLVTAATNVAFATVATTGSYNDLTDLPSLAGTYKFNIAADDSTVEPINSQETVQIIGGTNITTSLTDGVITVTSTVSNLSDLNNDLNISAFTNDKGYITAAEVPQTFSWRIGADDSTMRDVNAGEDVKILGGGEVTTASDAEGNITVSFTQDKTWGVITGTPTTLSGYGITDAATSAQGALADSAVQPGDNVSTLVNDAGYITSADIFRFNIAADDSTTREVTKDETVKFIGSQNVTTASDAEGNITITGPDLSSYLTSYTETDPVVGAITGIVKADGAGNISAAIAGTDYSTFDGAFASLTSKPTTISGYGITDAYTKTEVDTEIANLIDSAPGALDTLNELAAAINDDANFAATVTTRFTNIENNVFAIGADDSTLRTVKQGEGIKIIGGTNLTTSSDAEGNITVDFVNPGFITAGLESGDNVSELVNDAGYFTRLFVAGDDSTVRTLVRDETIQFQGTGSTTTSTDADGNVIIDSGNETITLFGDVTGSGTTSINTTLKTQPVSPGVYNKVTVLTTGVIQNAELVDYLEDGDNVSRLVNDAGYLTADTALNFDVVGDDSTGFNLQSGNTVQFTGSNGITIAAATDNTVPTVTINGDGLVRTTGDAMTGNLTFGDDDKIVFGAGSDLEIYHQASDNSSRIVESGTGNLYIGGNNIYLTNPAVNETYLDAVENGTVRLYYDNQARLATTATGVDVTGTVNAGAFVGDLTGSVVADDSTVIIDGVSGKITTTQLDQYEENQTWSPVVTPGSGAFNAVTATGRYTRIGKMCYAWFEITLTDIGTGTGALNVGGLPFTSSNEQDVQIGSIREAAVTGKMGQFVVNPNGTSAYIQDVTGAGGANVMTNSYRWTGGVTYQTA
jgi:hypothetical protein